MPSPPMSSTLPCQVVLDCARAHSLETQLLCERARVDPRALADPEARVPITTYYALLEQLATLIEEPHVGLQLSAHAQPASYGLLGFLFMRSPSVGHAFERMLRYYRLVADPLMTMELRDGRATVSYELWGPPRPAHDHVGDAFAAETILGFSMLCGPEVELELELELTRALTNPAPYLDALGVEPSFDAPELRLSFDARVLELPVQAADPALSDMLEHQAALMLRALPPRALADASYGEKVRSVVLELLPNGVPRIEQIAKQLAESPRSLQRHLHDEGTSVKATIDDVRRELGKAQLRRGASTTELALILGFSEVSTFHRAFKRWTGLTPGQWRSANPLAEDPVSVQVELP